ncbi:uncharacterized protein BDR25DRAFT_348730 [Lindgomyces ingoldianus]|uniref:Uncharacterized protein n=1 Tax=Lindgomyces ingoldianus TaxID=673940 RepID=A0ACB6RC99_9PLEO|nr:uncharacterized protein BDR25DRAFT_348730 [Lindgomyces ingoldianus]KAF2476806.1 hypothetical protein BDR25DRAFT_348730 [Lindgomyces ingoldianus]
MKLGASELIADTVSHAQRFLQPRSLIAAFKFIIARPHLAHVPTTFEAVEFQIIVKAPLLFFDDKLHAITCTQTSADIASASASRAPQQHLEELRERSKLLAYNSLYLLFIYSNFLRHFTTVRPHYARQYFASIPTHIPAQSSKRGESSSSICIHTRVQSSPQPDKVPFRGRTERLATEEQREGHHGSVSYGSAHDSTPCMDLPPILLPKPPKPHLLVAVDWYLERETLRATRWLNPNTNQNTVTEYASPSPARQRSKPSNRMAPPPPRIECHTVPLKALTTVASPNIHGDPMTHYKRFAAELQHLYQSTFWTGSYISSLPNVNPLLNQACLVKLGQRGFYEHRHSRFVEQEHVAYIHSIPRLNEKTQMAPRANFNLGDRTGFKQALPFVHLEPTPYSPLLAPLLTQSSPPAYIKLTYDSASATATKLECTIISLCFKWCTGDRNSRCFEAKIGCHTEMKDKKASEVSMHFQFKNTVLGLFRSSALHLHYQIPHITEVLTSGFCNV